MNADQKTPKELLHQFYVENNLPLDGGQGDSYVKIEITKKFSFYFPNFEARRKAVIIHDIHHLVTGYSAGSLAGESEISAWEIASGCKSHPAAFFINTSGVMLGINFNLIKVIKAFARGRRTKNFYNSNFDPEFIMGTNIAELKKRLELDTYEMYCKPGFMDFLLFAGFLLYGGIYSLLSFLLLPFIVVYSLYISYKIKTKKF